MLATWILIFTCIPAIEGPRKGHELRIDYNEQLGFCK